MSTALDMLLEKDRIIELLTLLFVRTDQRDWQAVRDCFADRVSFDMTSMAGGDPVILTPAEIVAGWDSGLRPLTAVHHQLGNFLVNVREQEADASCYGIASHYLPNPANLNTRVFVGTYDFHLIRDGARWRIDLFRFNLKYIEGNRDLEKSTASL